MDRNGPTLADFTRDHEFVELFLELIRYFGECVVNRIKLARLNVLKGKEYWAAAHMWIAMTYAVKFAKKCFKANPELDDTLLLQPHWRRYHR